MSCLQAGLRMRHDPSIKAIRTNSLEEVRVMMLVLVGSMRLERGWTEEQNFWKELEFDSYSDYAIFSLHLEIGKWRIE